MVVVVVDDGSAAAVLTGGVVVAVEGTVVLAVGVVVPVANAAARTRRSLACFSLLMAVVGSPFVSAVWASVFNVAACASRLSTVSPPGGVVVDGDAVGTLEVDSDGTVEGEVGVAL